MATSDGISTDDWDRVKELAIALLDVCDDPKEGPVRRGEMLAYLAELDRKYGPKPGLLATRADVVDDDAIKEKLLHEAFALAETLNDQHNVLLIAHSLAALYIEELMDPVEGGIWLDRLQSELLTIHDPWYATEAQELNEKLKLLRVN